MNLDQARMVVCTDTGEFFPSIMAAARFVGATYREMIAALRRPGQTSAGIHPDTNENAHWKYIEGV